MRGGETRMIAGDQLVPGDVVLLNPATRCRPIFGSPM